MRAFLPRLDHRVAGAVHDATLNFGVDHVGAHGTVHFGVFGGLRLRHWWVPPH